MSIMTVSFSASARNAARYCHDSLTGGRYDALTPSFGAGW